MKLEEIASNLGVRLQDLKEARDLLYKLNKISDESEELTDMLEARISEASSILSRHPSTDLIAAAFPNRKFSQEAIKNLHLDGYRLLNTILDFEL